MKIKLLVLLSSLFFISCHVTHNHYINDIEYAKKNNVEFSYIDYGNHIVVTVKHRHSLSHRKKNMLKRWYRKHHTKHKKRIKYKFVIK